MTILFTAWAFLKRVSLAQYGLIGLTLVAAWYHHEATRFKASLSACNARYEALKTSYSYAQEQAKNTALEQKVKIETHYVKVKDDEQEAISARLRGELDRLRTQSPTATGNNGKTDLPVAPNSAADLAGTNQISELDKTACTEAVIKLEGWQNWYAAALSVSD